MGQKNGALRPAWRSPATRCLSRRTIPGIAFAGLLLCLTTACGRPLERDPLDKVVARYATLASALTLQDQEANSSDTAVAGDATSDNRQLALVDVATQATETLGQLDRLAPADTNDPRRRWLRAQLTALAARARQRNGISLSVNDELQQLYGVSELPTIDADTLTHTQQQLHRLLPGSGDVGARLEEFETTVTVPRPRLAAVFERAMAECRTRTRSRVELPSNETVSVRYVVNQPWSGFSTYLGDGRSLVSLNTSYALTVDRVLELACHEGYPGHHVINVLRDAQAQAGRPELTTVPLFTPEAYESEVIATHAASLVFSDAERLTFEREVLFPLAGLDPALADRHVAAARLLERLSPAISATLVQYLAGEIGFVEANWKLREDALMQHPQATLEFVRRYKAFSLAYTGTTESTGGITAEWLGATGFPVRPVIISSNGDHSSASSHRRKSRHRVLRRS